MTGVRPDLYNAKNAFPIITIPALSSFLFFFLSFLFYFFHNHFIQLAVLLIIEHDAIFCHGCAILQ